jgi:predicted dehydrogenase
MQAIRIGVVGLGNFGQLHARTLLGMAETELVALVDSSAERRAPFEQNYPAMRCFSDLNSALEQVEADAWVIATNTGSHIDLAEQILQRGASVLIEKPLAKDVATAQRLERLVKPDSSNVMLGHILLFSHEFRKLRQEMQQRGPLQYFHSFRHRPTITYDLFPNESPVRLLMVHDLYMAQALTNGAEPLSIHGRLRPHPNGGYDLALAEFEWPDNLIGSFTASYLTPPGMPNDGFDRLELFGEGWAAKIEANPRPLNMWSDRAEWPLTLDINDDPIAPSGWLAEELRHFSRVVRGVASVPAGARYRDGLQIMRWLDRLEQIGT